MVLISIKDQEQVNTYIENVEKQLRMLKLHLNDVAKKSNDDGFLQVGEYVQVGKKSDKPNEVPTLVLECGKIVDVKYVIKSVTVKYLFEAGGSQEKPVRMVKEFNSDDDVFLFKTIPRPVGVNLDSDDDENEGSFEDESYSEEYDNNTD